MSKETLAGVWADMLEDEAYRDQIQANPALLDDFDLTDVERQALVDEANMEVAGFDMRSRPALQAMRGGGPCSRGCSTRLGNALNMSAGMPTTSSQGPDMVSSTDCCPWNKPPVGSIGGEQM
jgi:hypothetical protein